MPVSRNVLSALAAAATVAKVKAAMGPAFSTGPTSSDTYIVESWATLTLPDVPSDNSGDLSLWVGMGTSNGDLIQSIAENYGTSDWSVYAYTLLSTGDNTQMPVQSEGSTADAGAAITFHYKYDDSTKNYTQTVYKAGTVVSTLSTSDGEAQGWGSSVECAAEDCGTVPAHTWSNVSITLSAADAAYSDTMALGTDVTGSMSTSDGGITWEVGTFDIPCWDFSSEAVCSGSSSSTSSGSAASATATAGASSSSNAASPYGASSYGSSTYGSPGAQSSGTPTTGGSGSDSGSPTWGSSSASQSAGSGSHHHGFGGKQGGSSSWGAPGSQSSGASSFSGFSQVNPSWARSRIARPHGNN